MTPSVVEGLLLGFVLLQTVGKILRLFSIVWRWYDRK